MVDSTINSSNDFEKQQNTSNEISSEDIHNDKKKQLLIDDKHNSNQLIENKHKNDDVPLLPAKADKDVKLITDIVKEVSEQRIYEPTSEECGSSKYLRQYELIDLVAKYNPNLNEDFINRAYVYAMKMHGSQLRASGDPYFAHPVQVAGILTELKLDEATIVTGLLHDTIEDTPATSEEIASMFNQEVADLVDGVTKLTKLEVQTERTTQAENLQKFMLALSKDIRVLLVKLADRLHNMRTLHFIKKPEKRKRIAKETLDIYAPLARRIGVSKIASQLENLAFAHLHTDAYYTILRQLEENRQRHKHSIDRIISVISKLLADANIKAKITGREKRPYSIWKKLSSKTVSFHDISDIYGFRIIVDNDDDCYRALGRIHSRWHYVPGRLKDYISAPKLNGYRSIHTTVVSHVNTKFEIQIRTEEMDSVAEFGVAAHWKYKNQSYGYHPDSKITNDPMAALNSIFSILQDGGDVEDFYENAKLEMFQDQVFIFTPKGDLHALPRGATSVDFAYAVHTKIGDTIVGAKINGTNMPLRTPLRSGDIVEILRSNERKPPPNWESLAITGKARSGIKRLLNEFGRKEDYSIGKKLVAHSLRKIGYNIDEFDFTVACERLKYKSQDEMFMSVGRNKLTITDLLEAAIPGVNYKHVLGVSRVAIEDEKGVGFLKGDAINQNTVVHFMKCCSPLPGERIVGIRRPDNSIEVHTIDCEKLVEYEEEESDEDVWVDIGWSEEAKRNGLAIGRLQLTCVNEKGVFAQIAKFIANSDGNIVEIKTINKREGFIDLLVDIEVADTKHINAISASLRSLPSITNVERLRGKEDESINDEL